MNTYPFINYNNLYNTPFYTNEKKSNNDLYDTYNGFIRGNMFKSLYDPYLKTEPYEVKAMNEQAETLTYIDALCFAMNDINLYLDVYPDDMNMINLFNKIRKEKETVTKDYESKYGPITLDSNSLDSYPWAWDDMPWPWNN